MVHSTRIVKPAVGLVLATLTIATGTPAQAAQFSAPTQYPFSPKPVPLSPPQPVPINEAYTLGAGDRIQVDLFDVPEYSGANGRYQVSVDGTINVPLLGSFSVQSMTLKQLETDLSHRYARFFKRSLVTVSLIAFRPLTIGISGEVSRPGTYTVPLITQDNGIQFPTLTRALQLAGGITQAADVRQVRIRRPQRNGTDKMITIDLWNYLQTGNVQQDLTLRDGDSIVVATSVNPNPAEAMVLADTTFASDRNKPLNVAIVGEVFRPGSYLVTASNPRTGPAGTPGTDNVPTATLDRLPTVTRAIQVAGGIKPLADIRHIQIRRPTRTGAEQVIDVNLLQLLQTGDLHQDVILQSGDTITIPTATNLTPAEATQIASASFSPDSIKVNIVGEVKSPGAVQVPPNTPMNQAILAAGGFDMRRARTKSVELIHLNPDGTVTRRSIPVDFGKGLNDQTNPALQNNDIVVVGRSGLTSFTDTLGTILSPVGSVLSIFNFLNIFGLP